MLVRFDPKYRRAWMFPRNIRKIHPWKMVRILTLLDQVAGYDSWVGNQAIQNSFSNLLAEENLKGDKDLRDPNSGGARTYFAQMKSLGIVFQKGDKYFKTLAGEALTSGDNPLSVIQSQLLKHQYPSAYGLGQNVRIHPDVKVKPFLFVLDLLDDPEIVSLSDKELIIPVAYGHNDSCFDLCKDKILKYRISGDLEAVIDNQEIDIYTPRSSGSPLDQRLSNFKDIANTFKNYMESACLVNSYKDDGYNRIIINEDYRDIIENAREDKKRFIPHPENEESFLRKYGLWKRSKDTRNLATDFAIKIDENKIIQQNFYLYCGQNLVTNSPNQFIDKMIVDYGFSNDQIVDAISDFVPKSQSLFEHEYLQLASGGTKTASAFEKATGQIFEDLLKFNVELTGQKHRQGRGGYSDLFLIALNKKDCAIVDTKASNHYLLSHEDILKMSHTYVANYHELCDGKPLNLKFCSYVAGGFRRNIESGLRDVNTHTNIPTSAITAKKLLDLSMKAQTDGFNQDSIISRFSVSDLVS